MMKVQKNEKWSYNYIISCSVKILSFLYENYLYILLKMMIKFLVDTRKYGP